MKKLIYLLLSITIFLTSCDDWLDVKPKTNIEEEDLFKDEQGFKEALTGIYILMSDNDLYGRELTYGFIDALAQRYSVDPSNARDYTKIGWYEFPSELTEDFTNAIWAKSYNVIANINNLLSNIENRGEVLVTPHYKELIKGEALGLRSFLYFDLLRMFGPIYKDNPSSPSIPYRTNFNRATAKLLPAKDIADSLIICLKEAETLLEKDPMNISFPADELDIDTSIDPFLNYRFNRMNKYAVKAELARIYLYIGDKKNASDYANQVINAQKEKGGKLFSLITDNAQDHVGSTELLFSLSMDSEKFEDQIENEFLAAMWSNYYIKDKDRVYKLFDTSIDGSNDMRMKEGQGFSITNNGSYTLKYTQKKAFSYVLLNQMPLLRLPEMYYIVAESTDDLTQSAKILSTVRGSRGLEDINTFKNNDDKQLNIEKEYRKEFYAEGQLWYFYKRNGYNTFQFCPVPNMVEKNYRFSIPDDEVSLGNIN